MAARCAHLVLKRALALGLCYDMTLKDIEAVSCISNISRSRAGPHRAEGPSVLSEKIISGPG